MTMIALTAPGGPHRYEIHGNGRKLDRVVRAWALWNGGPGMVEYHPVDVHGNVYLDDSNERVASAFRLFGRLRVDRVA